MSSSQFLYLSKGHLLTYSVEPLNTTARKKKLEFQLVLWASIILVHDFACPVNDWSWPVGGCDGYPFSYKIAHNHLLIACVAHNWHLPSIWILPIGKLMLEDGLTRPLPIAQLTFKSYLPSMKIYLPHTPYYHMGSFWGLDTLINLCCFCFFLTAAPLVKPIPFQPFDSSVSGPDIFQRLIPMGAHTDSSLYRLEVWTHSFSTSFWLFF